MSEQPNPSCSGCGGPHPFDTTVPSVVWNAVIRSNRLPDYLCLTCIVAAFVRAGQSFTAELVGGGFHGAPIEVRVNDAVAQDATRVSEENTRLRSALFAKEARIEALEKAANEQAEDEGLWFHAATAPEAYLQKALRRLHALIEGDMLMAALAKEKKP